MQNKGLLFLLLAGSVFLFAPPNNVLAAQFGCNKGLGAPCENITAADYATAEAECASFCAPEEWRCSFSSLPCPQAKNFGCTRSGEPCQNVSAPDNRTPLEACASVCEGDINCVPSAEACGAPRVFGCEINTGCRSITAINYEFAQRECVSLCGSSYSHCLTRRDACPSAVSAPAPSDPLAGASVDALKKAASSDLNKAKFKSPEDLINRVIQLMMAFIGSIALVLYIVSGFMWMTASGNSDQVSKAKTTMVWTTLGVVMMLASYMLASFVFKSLGV